MTHVISDCLVSAQGDEQVVVGSVVRQGGGVVEGGAASGVRGLQRLREPLR